MRTHNKVTEIKIPSIYEGKLLNIVNVRRFEKKVGNFLAMLGSRHYGRIQFDTPPT